MKTNVYIDGFNLYYGRLEGTMNKWLDLGELCRRVLSKHTINRIRYFTALVDARPDDPQKPQRQQAYLRALRTIPHLSVHFGHFLTNQRWMPLVNPPANGPKTVLVWRTEEKGSDVNLATYLILDGVKGDYEMAVVVSNDSDLVEPIRTVTNELKLPIGVLNPQNNTSWALRNVATFYRPLRHKVIRDCQFPPILNDQQGTITKPASWYPVPPPGGP